jgi:Flp pilus assembly protein TadD
MKAALKALIAVCLCAACLFAADDRDDDAFQKDDFQEAIELYTHVVKLYPKDSSAYATRGIAYAISGDTRRAIADYTQAIKLDPSRAIVYSNRGLAYYELGDLTSAAKDAQKACELGVCKLSELMKQKDQLRN